MKHDRHRRPASSHGRGSCWSGWDWTGALDGDVGAGARVGGGPGRRTLPWIRLALALGGLPVRLYTSGVAVAGVAVAFAMLVGTTVMVGSLPRRGSGRLRTHHAGRPLPVGRGVAASSPTSSVRCPAWLRSTPCEASTGTRTTCPWCCAAVPSAILPQAGIFCRGPLPGRTAVAGS